MKNKKIQVSVTLETDLLEWAKARAAEEDRPFSNWLNYVLKDAKANWERQRENSKN
nr:MAG TPA: repressor [Caudoviricetes sp.]